MVILNFIWMKNEVNFYRDRNEKLTNFTGIKNIFRPYFYESLQVVYCIDYHFYKNNPLNGHALTR